MPAQPPAFRAPGWRERKPWAIQEGAKDIRKRGRAGMRERLRVLQEEPLCRECVRQGRVVASAVVDHIMPLSWGGSDARGNKQGLCKPCHEAKSAAERAADRQGRV